MAAMPTATPNPGELFPPKVEPMLATASTELPAGEEWVFELKWDGIRALCFVDDGRARFVSRNGNDLTPRWPGLVRLPTALAGRTAVLDGEVVAFDHLGRPSFSALQEGAAPAMVGYLVFDLLHLDGHSQRDLPWTQRRAALEDLAPVGAAWQLPGVWDDGGALQQASRDQGLEGVMAKRRAAPYLSGRRSRDWQKVKNISRQELVIGGWIGGAGGREGRLGALLVGYYDEAGVPGPGLRFAGRVGTGFTNAELERLARLLGDAATDTSPFAGRVPHKGCRWVRPELVAEVAFAEWTHLGTLRHPAYKGLRSDRAPLEVVREDRLPERSD